MSSRCIDDKRRSTRGRRNLTSVIRDLSRLVITAVATGRPAARRVDLAGECALRAVFGLRYSAPACVGEARSTFRRAGCMGDTRLSPITQLLRSMRRSW